MPITIRRATSADTSAIVALVRSVVFETYAALIEKNGEPPKGDPARWARAHIAEEDGNIIGVGLAADGFISDLWVSKDHRGHGVGTRLLAALEEQIMSEGYSRARLRVVTDNNRARTFYCNHDWREVRVYFHERDGHLMTDMEKELV